VVAGPAAAPLAPPVELVAMEGTLGVVAVVAHLSLELRLATVVLVQVVWCGSLPCTTLSWIFLNNSNNENVLVF
jgi:hypothetical protein